MNAKKFSDAMSELDTKYVDEALNYKKKAKKPSWIKWGSAAARFAIAVVIGVGILWRFNNPTPQQQDIAIYFLSESGAIESKSVIVKSEPKDIFDVWAALNNVSDVTLVDCVYDTQGTEIVQKDNNGVYSTLSLTVSPEFSKCVLNGNGVFLIETLRRTFYDNNSFDNMNLIIESLTDSAISNSIVEPGMQADDGKALVWEGMSEREIDETECYAFELRYSEDENINGEMAGRLIGIYAVSNDGTKFYQYNMADDTWEQLQSASIIC